MKYVAGNKQAAATPVGKLSSTAPKKTSEESTAPVRPEDYPVPGVSLKQYYSQPLFDPMMSVRGNSGDDKPYWEELEPEARGQS
jgi:hypothetical protein